MCDPSSRKEHIATLLRAEGFDAFGFCDTKPLEESELHLRRWLENDYHGEMRYMENHFEKRLSPQLLVPQSQTVIVVAYNYFPPQLLDSSKYSIAKYAYGKDYHRVMKDKLHRVVAADEALQNDPHLRIFVDSAPLLERALAVKAGIGFIGKNSCLIIPHKGSYFFLGEIVTSVALPCDPPTKTSFCGTCRRCLDACPTHALTAPQCLDARKCNSYLTIEYQGDRFQNPPVGNTIYGCDVCQDVCPHNRFATPHHEPEFLTNDALASMQPHDWETLTAEQFEQLFAPSAVKRSGWKQLKRNVEWVKGK